MIGQTVKHQLGYDCFIPNKFPPIDLLNIPKELLVKAAKAERLIGKLEIFID